MAARILSRIMGRTGAFPLAGSTRDSSAMGLVRGGFLARDEMLADEVPSPFELGPEMQVRVDEQPDLPPDLDQLGIDEDDGVDVPPAVQVACRQNEVSDARPAQVEIAAGCLGEDLQVVADDLAHGVRNLGDQRVHSVRQGIELRPELVGARRLRQAVGEEAVNLRIPVQAPVGQGHEPAAQVPDGRHVEVAAKGGRTPARIKGRDQMHGVVRVFHQSLARLPEGRPAREEQDARTEVRTAPGPDHADGVGMRMARVTRMGILLMTFPEAAGSLRPRSRNRRPR